MESDDPETPLLELHLKAEVLVEVEAKPASLHLGQLGRNEPAAKEFFLHVARPEAVRILSVDIADERFSIERLDEDPAGDARYMLRFAGGQDFGTISAYVVVRYAGAGEKEIRIPVSASLRGPLSYPKSIQFIKSPSSFPVRNIVIDARSGATVRIEKVEDSAGLLTLTILQREGEQAVIQAAVARPDEDYSTPRRHALVVTTATPEMPTLEIKYMISEQRQPALRH